MIDRTRLDWIGGHHMERRIAPFRRAARGVQKRAARSLLSAQRITPAPKQHIPRPRAPFDVPRTLQRARYVQNASGVIGVSARASCT